MKKEMVIEEIETVRKPIERVYTPTKEEKESLGGPTNCIIEQVPMERMVVQNGKKKRVTTYRTHRTYTTPKETKSKEK